MEGAKWKSTVLEISMNWWQLEFHPTEFQFYRINSGYGVVCTLIKEITEVAPEYSYEPGKDCIVCQVCEERFMYERELQTDFT